MMRPIYDAAVIGGGPAGACAAWKLAAAGHRVVMFERRKIPGLPVRCGELIRTESLAQIIDVCGPWTVSKCSSYAVEGPKGARIRFEGRDFGCMIARATFDAALVERATSVGTTAFLGTDVVDVARGERGGFRITTASGERLAARSVVIADGVASRSARWLGMRTATSLRGTAAAAFGLVAHRELREAIPTLRFGADLAPGGYAWLFPLGDGRANIGVGIDSSRSPRGALAALVGYAARWGGEAALRNVRVGALPITRALKPASAEGVLVVGDAARQVNPLTGAGIGMAARSGTLAGEILADALSQDDVSAVRLQRYDAEWDKAHGAFHRRSAAIRRRMNMVSDDALNRLIERLPEAHRHRSVADDLGLVMAGSA